MISEAPLPSEPSATEQKTLRLHVGGLPGKITEKDVEERFRSFGKVEKVDLIPHPFEENMCRGFAYVNLVTTDAQLSKCMNILNGCAWKGGRLQISQAKPNRFERLEDGRVEILKPEGTDTKKPKRAPKKKRKLVRHAGDQSLVNDKNVDKRKGWRRGRYGRAIACLRIRRPNRQMLIIDPSHYKNNLEKLFGSIRPKPLSHLTWTITDIESEVFEIEEPEINEENEEEVFEDALEHSSIYEDVIMEVDREESVKSIQEEPEAEPIETETFEPKTSDENMESQSLEAPNAMDTTPIDSVESESAEPKALEPESSHPEPSLSESKPAPSPQPVNFEVNVNWSSLFAPQASAATSESSTSETGFSLNSLFESKSSKIKDVSVDELFKKQPEIAEAVPSVLTSVPVTFDAPQVKKVHNYANLFGDLNRITPTTATRFGMHLSQKEDLLQEWRIERIELKEDFKKKLAEGKRRNRRNNNGNNNSSKLV